MRKSAVKQKISIVLPNDLLKRIGNLAKKERRSRSNMIENLIFDSITGKEEMYANRTRTEGA